MAAIAEKKKTEKKVNEHKDVSITLPKLKNTKAKVVW